MGNALVYSLGTAGQAVGKSKSVILRAIRRGTISAAQDPVTGNWSIDPAELHRVFPPVPVGRNQNAAEPAVVRAQLDAERAKTALLEGVVDDLRRRLDAEAEERRRTAERLAASQERVAALLADQRTPARPPVPAPEPPRSAWQRLMAWRRGP